MPNSTVEQPLKIPFIAAIVLHANAQKPEFTLEVLAKVGVAVQRQLEHGSWREVKLYLRFLACLQGMFEGDGIFPILEELFARAADLQMKSSEDVRLSPFYARVSANLAIVSGSRARQNHLDDHTLRHVILSHRA